MQVTPKKCEPVITERKESEDVSKENVEITLPYSKPDHSSAMRDTAKSRLRRLGALYAGQKLIN